MLGIWQELTLAIPAGVRPKQLIYNFFLFSLWLVIHFERFWNRLDFSKIPHSRPDTTMHAQITILHNCSQWHLIKDSINLVPYRVRVINVFFKLEGTFIPEPHELVDPPVLV
jgi:hypothetical protein